MYLQFKEIEAKEEFEKKLIDALQEKNSTNKNKAKRHIDKLTKNVKQIFD